MIQRAKGWSTLSNIDETIKLIEKNLSKDAEEINILDFGCGEGIYGHIIKACFHLKLKFLVAMLLSMLFLNTFMTSIM